ncbi:MAG TPA: site-2 protease family protein [Candidatus Deferrimicrobium sp.]|nr:site-2 protease family protein [Candidatus Deferrimicrobium sp.]
MNPFTLILYAIGGVVVIYFLLYVLTAQNILGVALKKSNTKIIPRSEVPGYLTKFYEIKETDLLNLGFVYHYCLFTEDILMKEYPQRYIFIYYHPQEKTYATLTSSDAGDYWLPYQVAFETHFKNGKKLVTFNGLKHSIIDTIPHTIIDDAYAETLEKHLQFHLQRLAGVPAGEGEIKEFDPSFSPEMLIKQYDQDREDYLNRLLQKGITYKVGGDKYGIKTLASLGIAHKMISGMNKMNTLRKKILAQKDRGPGAADLPVELEVTNYQNTRALLTPPIKNTPGKTFFLLVSLLLFAGAFSLIVSFEFMLMLAAAILLHETGHLLAMRLFGFKNLKMLFIPLFGAVAMGTDKGISPYKKVISYFAGPVPGIILGFLLLFQLQPGAGPSFASPSPMLFNLAFLLLVLNYFNLLPIMPFDGGQVFNTIIFSRFTSLQISFYLISLLVLSVMAVVLDFPLLFFVALLMGIGLFQAISQGRIMKAVKNELKTTGPGVLKKIFQVMHQAPYRQYPFKKKFQLAQNLENIFDTPKASAVTVMATLIFYIFLMGIPIIYLFGPGSLRGMFLGVKNPFCLVNNPCEIVAGYKPKPGSLDGVTRSDFERLPAQSIGDNCSKVLRYCFFYYPGSFNTAAKSEANPAAAAAAANNSQPGTFLAKLSVLYGKPDEQENNFSYTLLERKTGIIFQALLEQGTPVYISQEKDNGKMIPLCFRFEALLENIAPVDCHYICKLGTQRFEIGVSDGQPFFEQVSTLDKETLQKKGVVFPTPVSVTLPELPRMLSLYRALFVIGHDRWLNSEASMTRTILEVTGLPAGLTKEQQLELFPAIKGALGDQAKEILFKELKTPRAMFMNSGVYPDPANRRLLLIQGLFYSQDEARLAQYLAKVGPRVLAEKPGVTIDMEFLPGDYGDDGNTADLEKYYCYLKGHLTPGNPDSTGGLDNPGNLEITGAAGPINTPEKMAAWIEAAKFFAPFEEVELDINADYRLELSNESEARRVKELCLEVSENLHNITMAGKYLTVKKLHAAQLGLIVTYHRYGRKVMDL